MNGMWFLFGIIIVLCQWQFAVMFPELERTISVWFGRAAETAVILLVAAILDSD